MSTTQRTKEIFAALKHELGSFVPAGILIRIAAQIVAAYEIAGREDNQGGYASKDSFFARAVDDAMNDGGWRVLEFERECGTIENEETFEFDSMSAKRIRSFVGRTEWPRIEMVWL